MLLDHHIATFRVTRIPILSPERLRLLALGRLPHEENPDMPRRCRLLSVCGAEGTE